MKILIINAHLTYPGWSEGKLNLTFMDAAKAFFVSAGIMSSRRLSSVATLGREGAKARVD